MPINLFSHETLKFSLINDVEFFRNPILGVVSKSVGLKNC